MLRLVGPTRAILALSATRGFPNACRASCANCCGPILCAMVRQAASGIVGLRVSSHCRSGFVSLIGSWWRAVSRGEFGRRNDHAIASWWRAFLHGRRTGHSNCRFDPWALSHDCGNIVADRPLACSHVTWGLMGAAQLGLTAYTRPRFVFLCMCECVVSLVVRPWPGSKRGVARHCTSSVTAPMLGIYMGLFVERCFRRCRNTLS